MENTKHKPLATMMAEVDANCQAKGWREDPATFGEAMALLHEEIAEAGSAWRKHGLDDMTGSGFIDLADPHGPPEKPEGVGSELADIFIRLLDDCAVWGVDLDREIRSHQGQYLLSERFLENMNKLHAMVVRASDSWSLGEGDYRQWFAAIFVFLRQLCGFYGIDLMAEYERKMEFNRSRPYRHGNKRR